MKRSSVLMSMLLAMGMSWGGVAMAMPEGGHPPASQQMRMEKMAEVLGLTAAQKAQMKAIHAASREVMKPLRQAMKENRQAMHNLDTQAADYQQKADLLAEQQGVLMVKKLKLRAADRAQMDRILTPEQREKAKAWHQKKMQQRAGKGMCAKGGEVRPE